MSEVSASLRNTLEAGLAALKLELPAEAVQQLLDYVALLHKWNRAYNLTAVRDPEQMISRHVLDSLSILEWVRGPRLLDVGAGAGLPGIVLAIARPQLAVTLYDSNGKKVRFQRQAIFELGLDNVTAVHARVESLEDSTGFDQIVSRAFASVEQFVDMTSKALKPQGEWLAMVGQLKPLDALPAGVSLVDSHSLEVPGENGSRHLQRLALVHG